MAPFSISWANMGRHANGEKLVIIDKDVVTVRRAEYLKTHPGEATKFGTLGRIKIKQPFPLMKFPSEVRALILDHTVEQGTTRVFLPRGATPIPLPPAARAGDRLLRKETIRTTILKTQIEIHSGPGNAKLQNWLGKLDFTDISNTMANGFDAVKALKFPYFSRFPHHLPNINSNNDINLMLKCRNLAYIELNWVQAEVCVYQAPGIISEKSVDQLRREYYLDDMLKLQNLKVIKFSGYPYWPFKELDKASGIGGLAAWFKQKFAARDKNNIAIVLPDGSKAD